MKPKVDSLKRSMKLTNLAWWTKKKIEKTQISKIRNESGDITTNSIK